jgi:hypothetical protein
MADKKPLWRVMHEAYWRVAGCDGFNPPASPDCYAAELCAIADAVVPEEAEMPALNRAWYPEAYAKHRQRMATRALLLAEAERAEKGESNG